VPNQRTSITDVDIPELTDRSLTEDELAELRIGDSLRRRIDRGLRSSRFAGEVEERQFAQAGVFQGLDPVLTPAPEPLPAP
jgi:hypothetical protein